jgi:hypothetical protein
MIWHIFRKDLTLLWPLAALSAVTQLALDALMVVVDRNPDAQYLMLSARLCVLVVFVVIALVISVAVHQDALPGTRQDWLIRPIRRRDLLLAKLLFVVVCVQLPLFLGDVIEMGIQELPFGDSVSAAVSHNLYVFVVLSLPALSFAAATRNTAQFLGVGMAYFVIVLVATLLLSSMAHIGGDEQATNPLAWTGIAWIPQLLARLVLGAGAATVLCLLYLRRRLALGRILLPCFAFASALTSLLPWGWMFAAQEAVAASAQRQSAVSLAIDPTAPGYRPAAGEDIDSYSVGDAQVRLRGRAAGDIQVENQSRRSQKDVTVFIPIRVEGLPEDALPWVDRASITLRAADGRVLFQGRGDDLKFDPTQSRSGATIAYEALRISGLLLESTRKMPVDVEIDYSFTILRAQPAVQVAALDGRAHLPGFGVCTTNLDSDGNDVELRCIKAGDAPSCVSAQLADAASGRVNPQTRLCAPDYASFDARLFPDALSRFQVEAPFRDPLSLATYPVGSTALDHAKFLVARYDSSLHFSRHLSAAKVSLDRWTARTHAADNTLPN